MEVRKTNILWGENLSFQGEIEANWSAEKCFPCYDKRTPLTYVRESKIVLDSRLYANAT